MFPNQDVGGGVKWDQFLPDFASNLKIPSFI